MIFFDFFYIMLLVVKVVHSSLVYMNNHLKLIACFIHSEKSMYLIDIPE